MEKASKVIRRSSVRLKAISTGHSELNLVLCGLRDMRMAAKSFIQAQSTASQDLLRWSLKTENRAIQDTFSHLIELYAMWEDIQKEFAEHLKDFRNHFQMIYEGERHVDQARGHLLACESVEANIKKDLKKSTKKSNAEDVRHLEIKLAQAQRTKDLAQLEVVDKIQEHEAVKLIRVKESLMKLSESYLDLSNKCSVVFESHKDIARQLPDVQDKSIHDLRYTGSVTARQAVMRARERIHRYRREGSIPNNNNVTTSLHDDPPPPYSSNFVSPTTVYPEGLNPFYTPPQRYNESDLYPNLRPSLSPMSPLSPLSPTSPSSASDCGHTPTSRHGPGNMTHRLEEDDDEELVGAIGGVQL